MRANVEPTHAGESLWVEDSHFKVNLGNLEPLVYELGCIGLLSNELLGWRFNAKDGSFLKLHEVFFFLHQLGTLLFHKLLDLSLVDSLHLDTLKSTCGIEL